MRPFGCRCMSLLLFPAGMQTIDGEIPRMEKSKRAYLLRGVREVSRSTPDRW